MASGRGEYVDLKMCAERVLDEWIPLYVHMYGRMYTWIISTQIHMYICT